jgi:hypothetical protein
MQISIKGFIYHKEAETFEDCFDRYGVNISNNKFCVSDGVSKSFFPGLWAELLVESFLESNGHVDLDATASFGELQNSWARKVVDIVNRPNQKYYVKNFYAQGRSAAATFVGLSIFKDNEVLKWKSFALGDSFLFFVPKYISDVSLDFNKITYLSSKKNLEFDNFPDFFDSKAQLGRGKIKEIERNLEEGTFYLMTDALSEWFINEKQAAVEEISMWNTQVVFQDRISVLRKLGMHNDDAAILVIDVKSNMSNNLVYDTVKITDIVNENGVSTAVENIIINDPAETITQKFIQEDDEIKRVRIDESRKVGQEEERSQLENYIDDFEKKISLSNKNRKKKKKKRGFWEKNFEWLTNFVLSPIKPGKDLIPKNNKTDSKGNTDNDSANDIDSISDKF